MPEAPADLPGFICWDPSEVGRIINPEAAAPSIDVLLATHQPVPLEQLALTEAGSLQSQDVVAEGRVLDAVAERAGGARIVPIIGPSGSGKSHFVLWLHAQLKSRAEEHPYRRLVYIPKGDLYLENVIERILMDEEGAEFDQLRQAVREATASLDVPTAALRLRNAVAVAVGNLATEGDEALEVVVEGLPALLSDPTYKDYLVGEDGAFAVAAAAALGETDEEIEAGFVDGDLPIVPADVQEDMAAESKRFLSHLGNKSVKRATYEVLNLVRDTAMSEVFGIKPNQLVQVMRQLREKLFARDPRTEIVLMIEDFTLLQGVQYELLEAMLELPRRGDKQVLCEMKAVIAVTSGRFSELVTKNDTLRTRLADQGHVYRIDLAMGDESEGYLSEDQLISLLGRYLNVSRLGPAAVGEGGTVANACTRCPLEDKCHPVFQTDADDHGLYPLNPEFVQNLAASHAGRVNPRRVLKTLRTALVEEASAFASLSAPSESFLRHLEPTEPTLKREVLLLPAVRNEIDRADTVSAKRRVGVQTWWDRRKDIVADLDPDLLEAFGLSPIRVQTQPAPRERSPDPVLKAADAHSALDDWVDGSQLPAPEARRIRKQIRSSIVDILGGSTLLATEEALETHFRNDSIWIEGAAGGGALPEAAHREEFARSVENGVLFSCAEALSKGNLARVPPNDVVDYTAELHRRSLSVGTALRTRRADWEAGMPSAVRAVGLYALAAGLGGSGQAEDLLKGLVDDTLEPSEDAQAWFPRVAGGVNAFAAFRKERARVLGFATGAKSIGRGAPIAYDLAALWPPLQELCQTWEVTEADLDRIGTNLAKPLRGLGNELGSAHGHLQDWHKAVVAHVGADPKIVRSTATQLEAAQAIASKVGIAESDFRLAAATQSELPALVGNVGELLAKWDSLGTGQRIARVLTLSKDRLAEVREECMRADAILSASLDAATRRAKLGPGGDPLELAAAVEKSLLSLRATAEAAREHTA